MKNLSFIIVIAIVFFIGCDNKDIAKQLASDELLKQKDMAHQKAMELQEMKYKEALEQKDIAYNKLKQNATAKKLDHALR